MTDEEQDAQEKYLAEKTAELNRSERVITESKKTGTAVSTVGDDVVKCPKCGSGATRPPMAEWDFGWYCPKCNEWISGHEEKVEE